MSRLKKWLIKPDDNIDGCNNLLNKMKDKILRFLCCIINDTKKCLISHFV